MPFVIYRYETKTFLSHKIAYPLLTAVLIYIYIYIYIYKIKQRNIYININLDATLTQPITLNK